MKIKCEINNVAKVIPFDFALGASPRRNGFSVSLMETTFRLVLAEAGVSAKVYNNRPKSISPTVSDFVVASTQGSVEDVAAYGRCTLNVALFAKDAAGFKNSNKLSQMQECAIGKLPLSVAVYTDNDALVEEYLIDLYPEVLADVPDDYGFTCRIILFTTTIKVI